MSKWLSLILFIIITPIFAYSFFLTSWTASYLQLMEDWKDHLSLTPDSATDPQQIYEIDKFVYAFKIQPIISIVFILSLLGMLAIILLWIRKWYYIKLNA